MNENFSSFERECRREKKEEEKGGGRKDGECRGDFVPKFCGLMVSSIPDELRFTLVQE